MILLMYIFQNSVACAFDCWEPDIIQDGSDLAIFHHFYCLVNLFLIYFQQWYAIGLSNVGDYEGNKAKLQNAYTMKEHFEVRFNLSAGF